MAILFLSSLFYILNVQPTGFNLSIFLELTPSGGNDELQAVDG